MREWRGERGTGTLRVRVSAAAQLCAPSVDVRKEGRTPTHTQTKREERYRWT